MVAALLLADAEPETRGFLERHLPRDGFELVPDHLQFDLVLAGDVERLERWVERAPVIVLGRELFMTIFRHLAARRGVVISAIGPAKWKTGFQSVWVGAAYFWFFAATLAAVKHWDNAAWKSFAYFNGIVGTVTMSAAVFLTVYSLVLYLQKFRSVFTG